MCVCTYMYIYTLYDHNIYTYIYYMTIMYI